MKYLSRFFLHRGGMLVVTTCRVTHPAIQVGRLDSVLGMRKIWFLPPRMHKHKFYRLITWMWTSQLISTSDIGHEFLLLSMWLFSLIIIREVVYLILISNYNFLLISRNKNFKRMRWIIHKGAIMKDFQVS